MADLFLMSGVPGAGKSTFLKNRVKKDTSVVISRDVIRFSIVKPEEDYFSHEDEVLEIFWKQINESLAAGKDTFVDQSFFGEKTGKRLFPDEKPAGKGTQGKQRQAEAREQPAETAEKGAVCV